MSTQTWFITGASSGLGASVANAALRAGHRVAVTARDKVRLEKLTEAHPDAVLPLSMDLTKPSEIKAAITTAEKWHGGIDVLVNNAALGYLAAIEEGEEQNIRTLFDTNVFGVASTIRAVLPGMRARASGTIINVSSLNGVVSMPALGYYSASKHALEGLTEALSQEVAPLGIKVLSIGATAREAAGSKLNSWLQEKSPLFAWDLPLAVSSFTWQGTRQQAED